MLVAGRRLHATTRSTSPSTSSATASTASASPSPRSRRQGDNIVIDLPGVKDRDKADRARRARPPSCGSGRCSPILPPAGAAEHHHDDRADHDHRPDGRDHAHDHHRPDRRRGRHAAAKAAVASCDADRGRRRSPRSRRPRRADDKRDAVRRAARRAATASRLALPPRARPGSPARASSERRSASSVRARARSVDDRPERRRAATKFNALAAESYPQPSPQNQVGDRARRRRAVGARVPGRRRFDGGRRADHPGTSPQSEAEDLAKLINYGALPVQLEELNVENVSPTLGKRPARAPASSPGVIGLVARRALHARLLPAARAGRDPRPDPQRHGASTRSSSYLGQSDRPHAHASPASPASSCRSASPSTRTSSTSSG